MVVFHFVFPRNIRTDTYGCEFLLLEWFGAASACRSTRLRVLSQRLHIDILLRASPTSIQTPGPGALLVLNLWTRKGYIMSYTKQKTFEQTKQTLVATYGAFLRISDLAKVLKTSPESFQNTMSSSREANVLYLRANRRRFGRRVYFPAAAVAAAMTLDPEDLS